MQDPKQDDFSKSAIEIKPYPIDTKVVTTMPNPTPMDSSNKMLVTCRACGMKFDSTFSVDEFGALPMDQLESGTLHLCPHCGQVGIYMLKDYEESKS